MNALANKDSASFLLLLRYMLYFSMLLMAWAKLTPHCEKSFWDGTPVCQHGINLTLEISNLGNLIIWRREEDKMNNRIIGKLYFNKSRMKFRKHISDEVVHFI